jgi:L-fuconate dehydratase
LGVSLIVHLHEHFVDPCVVENGAYTAPNTPGFSIQIKPETLIDFRFDPTATAK